MVEKILEIRGIPLEHLVIYLRELKGDPTSSELPMIVKGDNWQAELLREEEVQITSRFHVNAVFIRFTAVSVEILDQLLSKFRKKTMRIGG